MSEKKNSDLPFFCNKCQKEIDEFYIVYNSVEEVGFHFMVECHGEKEKYFVSKSVGDITIEDGEIATLGTITY